MKYLAYAVLAGLLSVAGIFLYNSSLTQASTTLISVKPTATVTGAWTTNGTADASCTGHCQYVDEVTTGNGDGNTSYLSATSDSAAEEYSMGDISQGETVTSFKVYMYAECVQAATLGTGGYVDIVPKINGAALATSTATIGNCGANSWTLYNYTYNGTWTQSDVNSLALNFKKRTNGGLGNANMAISATYVQFTVREPDLAQTTGRVYANANSATPGAALGAANALTDVQQGSAFRIRAGITVSDYNWTTGTWGTTTPNTYKLQYSLLTAGKTCSTLVAGWGDVLAGSGNIRWNDNAAVADNATITSYASDPPVTGTAVYQTYRESNSFTNAPLVGIGNTGLWDFSLKDFSSSYGSAYCFRVVKTDGTVLPSYTNYPSILTVGSLSIDVTDASGVSVGSPSTPFSSVIVQPECQSSSATLGTSSQQIRVTNNISTTGWSVSMAATNGATAFWTNGTNGQYDYNDSSGSPPGCTDGGDADSYAGRLSLNPTTGSLVQQSGGGGSQSTGCTATGTSLGISSNFVQGTADAITLFSASSATPRFCYFSVTGISMTQQIPTYRPKGNYSLDFTLTVLAL